MHGMRQFYICVMHAIMSISIYNISFVCECVMHAIILVFSSVGSHLHIW